MGEQELACINASAWETAYEYYNLYELDHDDHFSNICADILIYLGWGNCCIPDRESNYNDLYELHHDYHFSNIFVDILIYEKIGKMLVVGDFSARVTTYQNVEVDDNVMQSNLMHD